MKGTAVSPTDLWTRLDGLKDDFIELVLSQPRKIAGSDDSESPRKITARPVTLKNETYLQFTLQFDQKQTHENIKLANAADHCLSLFPDQFEHLHLFTRKADMTVRLHRDQSVWWRASAPSKSAAERSDATAHNRSKQYLIPENVPCPFLAEIGVMNREGRVLAPMRNKFRQINRFLELVNDILPHLPQTRPIEVVDFGSGKSYLTFALHHLITVIHGRTARIHGIDLKREVIQDCSRIAEQLHCDGLTFHYGDIAGFSGPGQVDLMVCLHACDTATDAALAQAIKWETPVILAVPCCQHEVAANLTPDASLTPLTRHGILKERFAALATDAMRASLLESWGYQTQIIEFVDLEHTPKNLLIRAVRKSPRPLQEPVPQVGQTFAAFKKLLGLEAPCLERLLRDPVPPHPRSSHDTGLV